ncbi:MAG: hypothetical protein K6E18_09990 [Lachnospiraceae bacterium]|nr:hypothetical protein [Lachnospiraceae bacterium]
MPLPKPIDIPDDVLRHSWHNIQQYTDMHIVFLPKEEQKAFLNTELYESLSAEEGTPTFQAFAEPGSDAVYPYAEMTHPQMSGMKIWKVYDQDAYKEMEKNARDICQIIQEDYIKAVNLPLTATRYANALIDEIRIEDELVEKARDVKTQWEAEAAQIRKAIAQQKVRAAEELERVNEALRRNEEELQSTRERLDAIGDAGQDDSLEYNPFRPRVDRRQNEIRLEGLQKEHEELLQRREAALLLEKEAADREKETEPRLVAESARVDEQLRRYQQRSETIREQVNKDSNTERYEEYKEKAVAFMMAATANKIRRIADGFGDPYVLKRSPFRVGSQAFGPVLDVSQERELVAKIAASNRVGFPAYDCVIQTDKADQALCDYWKEKEEKGELAPEKEAVYRRKLYEASSQIEVYLDQMYKTSEDPEKSQKLKELQFTDPGNDPFHIHEKSPRGSALLRATAEAYKKGLENNWRIDDLGTLANFNYARRFVRISTLGKGAMDLAKYESYDKPQYTSSEQRDWLERMDETWEEMSTNPVYGSTTRNKYMNRMKDLMEEGYEKGFISKAMAGVFANTYAFSRDPEVEKQMEEGKISAVFESEGYSMGKDGLSNVEVLKELEKVDLSKDGIISGSLENQKSESSDDSFLFEDELNRSFISDEVRPAAENPDMNTLFPDMNKTFSQERSDAIHQDQEDKDWQFEEAYQKFTAERSAVFMGRESDYHKNLRVAVTELRTMKQSLGDTEDPQKMAEYLNKLDEVMAYSKIYQKERADAHTPAGIERLNGARDFESYAKFEQKHLREAYNSTHKTNFKLSEIREQFAVEKAGASTRKLKQLCETSMPESRAEKEQVKDLVADILVGQFAESQVAVNRKVFKAQGANILKNNMMQSKAFQKTMDTYFKQKNMTAADLLGDLSSGKLQQKLAKEGKIKTEVQKETEAEKVREQTKATRAHTI